MINITSGHLRGISLKTPAGLDTRPTRSRVRSAILNMIQFQLSQASVLDLFAGSGAFGIEAISRGASKAHFIDKEPDSIKCLNENLNQINKHTLKNDGPKFETKIERLDILGIKRGHFPSQYDIIFCDPPYDLSSDFIAMFQQFLPDILNPQGLFIFESHVHDKDYLSKIQFKANLDILKQKTYGISLISIWRYQES
ncbi:MAG: 16S rRNA (guanine(966)-N(2))-methyltransferase RsmD [Proteobacteria bacterium]|nr:16S rRNA (guanine(966)-N(2))-methyltransferase RsmD [Pseudomonadota bacterium]